MENRDALTARIKKKKISWSEARHPWMKDNNETDVNYAKCIFVPIGLKIEKNK